MLPLTDAARPDLEEIFEPQKTDPWPQQVMFLCFMGTAVLLLHEKSDKAHDALLWVFAGFLLSNALVHRGLSRWPGQAALVSLALNTILVALSIDMSGGRDSLLWPLYLMPIFTAGMALPSWSVRAAGLQTGLVLCLYIDPLREGEPGAAAEIFVKVGFLLASAWVIGRYGAAERKAALAFGALQKRKVDLEKEVERAHKLEALGALAGETAHDFRNILQVIMSHAQTAREALGAGHIAEDPVKRIERAAEKGERLISTLLEFGSRGVLPAESLDLNAELDRMRPTLEAVAGRSVRITIVTDPVLERVRADPERLTQALLNLASNSRDAMPKGGTLTLRTERVRRGEEELQDPAVPSGDWAVLSVLDAGSGMTPEALDHVFEPFFTTKKGRGTGLGLPTVYGTVRRLGGHIAVESPPGAGTMFRLYLPFWQP